MDNFNKIVSFVLGLIVVIVFLAVITGRLNLRNRISGGQQAKVSPTPTIVSKLYLSPTPISSVIINKQKNTYAAKTPSSIPATGSPTVLLPLLFSSLAGGLFLRKSGKKS